MLTAGSWEPSSAPRCTRARGPGHVHDGLAPALATHRLRITGRGAFLGPPSDVSAHQAKKGPRHGRWSPALSNCWPGSEAGPGLYGPGVTTPGSRRFQRKQSSKSQPAVDDVFAEHGVFLQVLTVSRKTGQEQPLNQRRADGVLPQHLSLALPAPGASDAREQTDGGFQPE